MAEQQKVFANFPYDKKFTREEITEITRRAEELAEAMRDGVAPNGAILGMPEDMLKLWCVHGALAGVIVEPDQAWIVARRRPDASGQYADAVEWVLKSELDETEVVRTAADAEAEAREYADAMRAKLTPAVRAEIVRQLQAADAEAHPDGGPR